MVADIADAMLNLRAGGCRREGVERGAELRWKAESDVQARFYLRFAMKDVPGAMAKAAECLARHGIGIDSVIQKEAGEGAEYVPVLMTTKAASAGALDAALKEAAAVPGLTGAETVRYRIEDFR